MYIEIIIFLFRNMDHYTLEKLALDSFGRQVSNIYLNLMKLSKVLPFSNFRYNHLVPMCTYIDNLVENNVAKTLANTVTEVTVKSILLSLKQWLRSENNQYSKYPKKCILLAVKFACATTHRSVTKLHYARLCDEYNTFTHDFLREYLGAVLEKAKHLRELVSLNHPGMFPIADVKNLLLWSGYITPEALRYLAISNSELRILNLNNPSISDRSISSILNFLKLIHLDIANTKLTEEGTERLIQGLNVSGSHEENCYKSGRSHLIHLALKANPRVLKIIPENLPNLTTLILYLENNMDLTYLRKLKRLKSLSLKCSLNVDFACVKTLIEQIGRQLETLNLDMKDINMKYISKYCPILKTLGLRVSLVDQEGNLQLVEDYRQHIPNEFKSVESLDLVMHGYDVWGVLPTILSCFTNVKIFKVYCDSEPEYGNVSIEECFIRPLREGRLEKIFINGYRLLLNGKLAVVSDNHGFSIIVVENDLNGVVRELIYRKSILNLHKRASLFPS